MTHYTASKLGTSVHQKTQQKSEKATQRAEDNLPNTSKKGPESKMNNSHKSLRKRQTTQMKKWAKAMNRYFHRRGFQMVNHHMKRCSAPVLTGKCKLKPQRDPTNG